jgi:hypothetical protein
VISVTVELNGQVVVEPAAVHAAATDQPIRLWLGKAGVAEDPQESFLQLAQADGDLAEHDSAQLSGAGGARVPVEYRQDLAGRRAVPNSPLVAGSGQLFLVENCCEVDEGLGNGGDWNALPLRAAHLHPAGSPRPDSLHAPLGERRDLGRRRDSLEEAKKMSGGASAEQRTPAASQNGGHVTGLCIWREVPGAVDTPKQAMKGANSEPPPDLVVADPGTEELLAAHNAVSVPCEASNRSLSRGFDPFRRRCPGLPGHWPG